MAHGASVTVARFSVNSSFVSVECRSRTLPSSIIGVAAVVASVTCFAQWANPVWELLLMDPASEKTQILEQVQSLLASMDAETNATDAS